MIRKHIVSSLGKLEMDPLPGRVIAHLETELTTEVEDLIRRRLTPAYVARAFALAFNAPVPRTGKVEEDTAA